MTQIIYMFDDIPEVYFIQDVFLIKKNMNPKKLLIGSTVLLLVWMPLSFIVIQPSTGPHGGQIKPVANYYIEMRKDYPFIKTWLLSKNQKAIKNMGIRAEIEFIYQDNSILKESLGPYGKDGFITRAEIFYACIITFHVFGDSVSAHFDNEGLIVIER